MERYGAVFDAVSFTQGYVCKERVTARNGLGANSHEIMEDFGATGATGAVTLEVGGVKENPCRKWECKRQVPTDLLPPARYPAAAVC